MQRVYLPNMLFLVETKQKNDYVRDVGVILGYDDMCIVAPQSLSGGIVVYCKNHVSVQRIFTDARLVDLYVEYKSFHFYLSCIYGNLIPKFRHLLWEKLQRISVSRTEPWMMCGDFNEILKPIEKRGGRVRNEGSSKDFKLMMQICDMQDLQHK